MPTLLSRNVNALARARGISEAELERRVDLTPGALAAELERDRVRKKIVDRLARELLVPDFALFMERPPADVAPLVDFRSVRPAPNGYARDTLRAIDLASKVQRHAGSVGNYDPSNSIEAKADGSIVAQQNSIATRAANLRRSLAITIEDQLAASDARIFFNQVRSSLEKLDTFVLQDSFSDGSGFCLASRNNFDVIVINTLGQNHARRLFTLCHEVYHCILNKSGLSDAFLIRNPVERQCNKFAVEFLAPASLVRRVAEQTITHNSLDLNEIRRFAQMSKLSMYASVLRLAELNLYSDTAVAAWHAYINQRGDPDVPSAGGGGRRVEEWKYKLSKYGFKFADVFGRAKRSGALDDLDIYRLSGLKPKYQDSYFVNAPTARVGDLADE